LFSSIFGTCTTKISNSCIYSSTLPFCFNLASLSYKIALSPSKPSYQSFRKITPRWVLEILSPKIIPMIGVPLRLMYANLSLSFPTFFCTSEFLISCQPSLQIHHLKNGYLHSFRPSSRSVYLLIIRFLTLNRSFVPLFFIINRVLSSFRRSFSLLGISKQFFNLQEVFFDSHYLRLHYRHLCFHFWQYTPLFAGHFLQCAHTILHFFYLPILDPTGQTKLLGFHYWKLKESNPLCTLNWLRTFNSILKSDFIHMIKSYKEKSPFPRKCFYQPKMIPLPIRGCSIYIPTSNYHKHAKLPQATLTTSVFISKPPPIINLPHSVLSLSLDLTEKLSLFQKGVKGWLENLFI